MIRSGFFHLFPIPKQVEFKVTLGHHQLQLAFRLALGIFLALAVLALAFAIFLVISRTRILLRKRYANGREVWSPTFPARMRMDQQSFIALIDLIDQLSPDVRRYQQILWQRPVLLWDVDVAAYGCLHNARRNGNCLFKSSESTKVGETPCPQSSCHYPKLDFWISASALSNKLFLCQTIIVTTTTSGSPSAFRSNGTTLQPSWTQALMIFRFIPCLPMIFPMSVHNTLPLEWCADWNEIWVNICQHLFGLG